MELGDMRMAVTPYLEKLAAFDTPDLIAEFLTAEGVKAVRVNGSYCAIAQYVRQGSGVEEIIVGSNSTNAVVSCDLGGHGEAGCLMTTSIGAHTVAMTKFVHRFDGGHYPELVA